MQLNDLPDDILEFIYILKHRIEMKPVLNELISYSSVRRLENAIIELTKSLMIMELRRLLLHREIMELVY